MTTIRWGLLSTANINNSLIPAIRASKRGELVAVASRTQASADAYAKEKGIPKAFGSYEAMLASGEVDVIYNSLPNHLHAEWSIKAMEAGVHVLCEKPFAISLDEVDAMVATSERTGKALAEAFMYRHHPQTKILGEWVHGGRLGEIESLNALFTFAFTTRDNIRLVPEWGGGCLWDVGVYPLSLAQFVFGGPPQHVSGSQWLGNTGVDESFAGLLQYEGNRFAQITASFRTPFNTRAEIVGTEGRIVLNKPFVNQHEESRFMTFFPKDGEPQEISVPEKSLYLGEVEDMHAIILEGATQYLSLGETRNHVRTLLALYQSARTNQVVTL